jgi:hypothetical protein
MKAISRAEAVDFANRVLESDDANGSERRLARYVLAMDTIIESFVQDAEKAAPAPRPRPDLEREDRTCNTCGTSYAASTLREAYVIHKAFQPNHALTIWEGNGFSVVTSGTLREIERPSGEVADRGDTGPNDPYSSR